MGTGAVGFDPEFRAVSGAVDGHHHAAVAEAAVVLMHIVWLQCAVVTVLVAMKRAADFGRSEDGLGSGRDKDSSKRKERGGTERGMAHSGCSGKARLGIETSFMLTTITPLLFCA